MPAFATGLCKTCMVTESVCTQVPHLTVKKYFVGKGIADSRLTPIGFGQDKPIADNKTPAGKAKNRRVSFEVSMLP